MDIIKKQLKEQIRVLEAHRVFWLAELKSNQMKLENAQNALTKYNKQ